MPSSKQPDPAPEYLDIAAVAKLAGVQPATITRYRGGMDPTFPVPDITLSGRPGWRPETIQTWLTNRPGQGTGGGRPSKGTAKRITS